MIFSVITSGTVSRLWLLFFSLGDNSDDDDDDLDVVLLDIEDDLLEELGICDVRQLLGVGSFLRVELERERLEGERDTNM